jgi:hypothetical protein
LGRNEEILASAAVLFGPVAVGFGCSKNLKPILGGDELRQMLRIGGCHNDFGGRCSE